MISFDYTKNIIKFKYIFKYKKSIEINVKTNYIN